MKLSKQFSKFRLIKIFFTREMLNTLQKTATSISWNRYSGLINGNTLRKKHNEW